MDKLAGSDVLTASMRAAVVVTQSFRSEIIKERIQSITNSNYL